MDRNEVKRRITERFGAKVRIAESSPKRVYVYAENDIWVELATFLFKELRARFDTGCAVDDRDGVEIMFFWPFDGEHYFVTTKTFLAKPSPTIDSISPVIPGAKWIEREMWEMYEVSFRNHPDLRPLLRADTRPVDYFPARREIKDEHETARLRDDGKWRSDEVAGKPPRGKNP